jgi:hypothetical protein
MVVEALPIQVIVAVVIPTFQVVTVVVVVVTNAPNKTINNIRYTLWEKASLTLSFSRYCKR